MEQKLKRKKSRNTKASRRKGLEQRKKEGRRKGERPSELVDKLLLVAIIVFAIIFVFSCVQLLRYYGKYRKEANLDQELSEIRKEEQTDEQNQVIRTYTYDDGFDFDIIVEERLSASRLHELNPDYVGWVEIPDTKVDYPVVQRDNDFYLTHDFMGEKNKHGTIFLDESCVYTDSVLLLHGHHMKDGTMFGGLKDFKKKDFAKDHDRIQLDYGTEIQNFQVFAVDLIDFEKEDAFFYHVLPDDSNDLTYLNGLLSSANRYKKEGVKASDLQGKKILLLSTCEYGSELQRLVVCAVETSESDDM